MSSNQKPKFLLGILIFDDAEVLDFCGPFEVFSVTGSLFENSFKVVTLAQKDLISAKNGLNVVPNYVIGREGVQLPKLDVLLIPGGLGTRNEVKNDSLIAWIKSVEPSLKFVLSVCTGAALLGKCGFVDNIIITTHRGAFDFVQEHCPKSKLCKCRRFTDNGKFLTSAGISAGIDLSFYFVKKNFGPEMAKAVSVHMEYDWADLECETCTCVF